MTVKSNGYAPPVEHDSTDGDLTNKNASGTEIAAEGVTSDTMEE